MKFEYERYIEDLGGSIVGEEDKKFTCKYNGFLFTAYKKSIRDRIFYFDGNFRACVNKVEYFKHYMQETCTHKNLTFDNSIYTGIKEHVIVDCIEHGKFNTLPYSLISRKSGCPKCYTKYKKHLVKNKGVDKFITESKEIFGDKFDYSLVNYVNTMTNVNIICNIHGVFSQTPHTHLVSKHACPKCSKLYNTFKMEDYHKSCADGSNLYVIELVSDKERFIKIGITKDIFGRFKCYRRAGYEINNNIIFFHKDAGFVFCLEDDLLLLFSDKSYVPLVKFQGWTECFSYVDMDHINEYIRVVFKLYNESRSG